MAFVDQGVLGEQKSTVHIVCDDEQGDSKCEESNTIPWLRQNCYDAQSCVGR